MLWPFAVKAAIERLNYLNFDLEGRTPASKFYGTEEKAFNANEFHTFGCPSFVLDSRLQSGAIGPPKWDPRARVGIYLGHSPFHAGSVSLVLNPQTGHVSPQYHVTFDDSFVTIPNMRDGIVPPTWEQMYENSTELATEEAFDLAKIWYKQLTNQSSSKQQDPYQLVPGPIDEGDGSAEDDLATRRPSPPENEGDNRKVAAERTVQPKSARSARQRVRFATDSPAGTCLK
jgi:hypothetical protein